MDSDHQLLNSTSPNHSLGLIQRLWARAPLAWFLLGAFWFVYLQVFILPFVPISFWADQSTYLLNARRMLDGQVIYRDFFQFTPPGTESVYFGLFRLFGPRSWIPDGMLLLLGVSLVGLITMISEKLINGASCFLPGLLFLVIPFQSLLDGTHHWYSTVAVMAALAVVIENRSVFRLAAAGTLCGLATCFTQSRGLVAVLGLAVFLLWERPRKGDTWRSLCRSESSLFVTFLASVVAFNAYFVGKAGLQRFLDCTIVFGVKYYPASGLTPGGSTWRTRPPYIPYPPYFNCQDSCSSMPSFRWSMCCFSRATGARGGRNPKDLGTS